MVKSPQRILVPTDFSSASEQALSMAKALANRFEAELHVLHVRQQIEDAFLEDSILDEVEQLLASGNARAFEILEEYRRETNGLRYQGHVERASSVPSAIINTTGKLGCDLVVMGTHGRRGWRGCMMGSVAEKVTRLSPQPTLTAPAGESHSGELPRNILVAHDFSEHSTKAVRWAAAWAQAFDARLKLLHVVQPLVYPEFYALDGFPEQLRVPVAQHCRAALRRLADELIPAAHAETVVVQGHAAESILQTATDNDQDLIVLATRGLAGIQRAVLGSVAARVLRLSPVPVLSIRA